MLREDLKGEVYQGTRYQGKEAALPRDVSLVRNSYSRPSAFIYHHLAGLEKLDYAHFATSIGSSNNDLILKINNRT